MAHLHEKIDFTVEVFIVNKGRVLLRLHDKYGIWLSVGGHIELNEDPIEAAFREVEEESGLKDIVLWKGNSNRASEGKDAGYKELIPPVFMNRHDISPAHEHISLVYFASSPSDTILEPENEKAGGWKWCTREDLETMTNLSAAIRHYAEAALEALA